MNTKIKTGYAIVVAHKDGTVSDIGAGWASREAAQNEFIEQVPFDERRQLTYEIYQAFTEDDWKTWERLL